ncbi:MAG TPA: GAF domain-containing SpoIIE family protein phosphatase [Terriglobales bacterium]|nr:GAF domain-containing SpoIIE family protein phosphatase [Terriglobales bacterium]
MATMPRPQFELPSQPMIDASENRIEELIRLQKSAQRITSTLNIDEIIDRIVAEVSESLHCVEINLYLHEPERNGLKLAAVRGCTLHQKGHRLVVGKEGMSGHVAATRRMHYAPDVRLDPYYVACEPKTRSEVAIPLEVDGELVGVFTASHHELDAFCDTQLRLFQGLCSHVAVAVQNARRFHDEYSLRKKLTREAEEARAIQQALLPRSSPLIPGFSVAGVSIPAGAVGGDWYDYIPLPDGRWGLVLADVSGKGTAAALLMSTTRGMMRAVAPISSGPAEVLCRVNGMLLQDFPDGRFVTMVYGELDPRCRTLKLANAGHLPPLVLDSQGARWIESEHGLPLGVGASKFSETEIVLDPSSRVTFYSDGITEADGASGEEYGNERLLVQLLAPDATPESLIADVRKFANGSGLRDDATVILVGARGEVHT